MVTLSGDRTDTCRFCGEEITAGSICAACATKIERKVNKPWRRCTIDSRGVEIIVNGKKTYYHPVKDKDREDAAISKIKRMFDAVEVEDAQVCTPKPRRSGGVNIRLR